MRFNEPDIMSRVNALIYLIVGLSIALIVFSNLIGQVAASIASSGLTSTNLVLAGLVVLVFIAGVVLAVFGLFALVSRGKM
jgi:hypothetical protein